MKVNFKIIIFTHPNKPLINKKSDIDLPRAMNRTMQHFQIIITKLTLSNLNELAFVSFIQNQIHKITE